MRDKFELIKMFIKLNKTNLLILAVAILVYMLFFARHVHAGENTADTPSEVQSFQPVCLECWFIPCICWNGEDNQAIENIEKQVVKIQEHLAEAKEPKMAFTHWNLALQAMQAGLLIVVIFAIVWGRQI